jgi:hypothetical protein
MYVRDCDPMAGSNVLEGMCVCVYSLWRMYVCVCVCMCAASARDVHACRRACSLHIRTYIHTHTHTGGDIEPILLEMCMRADARALCTY